MHYKHAAVSSDHPLCSEIGKQILKKGGNAVDSAIAVQFCVEVVNSHSTGIGGGGFMLIYDKKTGYLLYLLYLLYMLIVIIIQANFVGILFLAF